MISEITAILPAEGPDFRRTTRKWVDDEIFIPFLGKLGRTTADLNEAFKI